MCQCWLSALGVLLTSTEEVGLLTLSAELLSLAAVGLYMSSTMGGLLTSFAEAGLLMSCTVEVLLTSAEEVGLLTSFAEVGLLMSLSSSSVSSLSMMSSGTVEDMRPILAGRPNKASHGMRLIPASSFGNV